MSESPEMNRLDPADRELERALESLRPTAPSAPRDEMFYRAGYDAGHRDAKKGSRGGAVFWRFAAGGMGALAAGLALLMFLRSAAPVEERIIYVDRQPKAPQQSPGTAARLVKDDRHGASEAADALPSGWFVLAPRLSLPEWGVAKRSDADAIAEMTPADSGDEVPILRRLRFEKNLGVSADDVGGRAAYRFVTRHVNDTFGEGSL